jgi:anti-sigma factor RsiW
VTHLGDRACLLVDGELDAAAHDDAMAHLAGCAQCRRQVTAYRHLKAWLAQTPAEPGPALIARLLPIPERQPVLCELGGHSFTGSPSPTRSRARSVAAAGFAASVVVGLGAAATGSSSVAAGSGTSSLSGSTSAVTSLPIGMTLLRPGNPAAVSVVYRRP